MTQRISVLLLGYVCACAPAESGESSSTDGGGTTASVDPTAMTSGSPTTANGPGDGDGSGPGGDASSDSSGEPGTDGPGTDSGLDTGDPPPPPDCYDGDGNPMITALAPGDWLAPSGTQWIDHCACEDGFPEACGPGYCAGEFAYSGGAFSSCYDAMIVWGGGHNDYWGNEVYWFKLETMQWERLTDPSPTANCVEVYPDGNPSSRHTYESLAVIDHAGRLFAAGGAIACDEGGSGDGSVWTFDLGTRTWHDMEPTLTNFDDIDEIAGSFPYNYASAYDPSTGLVYLEANHSVYAYDYDANTITWITSTDPADGGVWIERTAEIIPDRHLLISIGEGTIRAYDLSTGTLELWTTTGPSDIVDADAPGLAYDPSHGVLVGWENGDVFRLDLDTREWSADDRPWPVGGTWDVFGRFAYSAVHDAFVAIPDPEADVGIYKN